MAPSGQEAQLAILPGLDPQPVIHTECGVCSTALPGQGNKLHPGPMADYNLQSHLIRKLRQRTLAAMEPIL